jgi:hypothetical protein
MQSISPPIVGFGFLRSNSQPGGWGWFAAIGDEPGSWGWFAAISDEPGSWSWLTTIGGKSLCMHNQNRQSEHRAQQENDLDRTHESSSEEIFGPGTNLEPVRQRVRESLKEKQKRTQCGQVLVGIPTRKTMLGGRAVRTVGGSPCERSEGRAPVRSERVTAETLDRRSPLSKPRSPTWKNDDKQPRNAVSGSRDAKWRRQRAPIPVLKHRRRASKRHLERRQDATVAKTSEGLFLPRSTHKSFKL